MLDDLLTVLKERFGLSAFRPGQEEAIRAMLEGRDVLVVMPTGAGKSLCYELPAIMDDRLTLVVSPLIALMKDQVDGLVKHGINATFINSSLSPNEQSQRLEGALKGKYQLLYVAPERFRQVKFMEPMSRLKVSRFVVDEAHCISEWGHDFRPDYLVLGAVRKTLGFPPGLAATAAATPRVRKDIIESLCMSKVKEVITGFDRPKLRFEVRHVSDMRDKWFALGHLLASEPGSGILYAGTRWASEEAARFCREALSLSCEAYHAGLEGGERTRIQDAFMSGKLSWVAATSAFGLGVNKEDVRVVAHLMIPESLESYYQEIGRAGRDNRPARAVLFFAPEDEKLSEWMIQGDSLARTDLVILYHTLLGGSKSGRIEASLKNVRTQTGLSEVKLRLGLHHLEDLGALIGRREERGTLHGEILIDVIRQTDLDGFEKKIQMRRDIRRGKLSEMVRYARSTNCRRRFLLAYFGEKPKRSQSPCCDVCSSLLPETLGTPDLAVLAGVKALRWKVGKSLLVRILKGSRGAKFLLQWHSKSSCYGLMKQENPENITARIEALLNQGYLKIVGRKYPVLSLTFKGEEALSRGYLDSQVPHPQEILGDIGQRAVWTYHAGVNREVASVLVLLSGMSHGAARLRALSASALGKIADDRALGPLLKALDDPFPEVRQYSAIALGALGLESALPALQKLLRDPEEMVNTQACVKSALEFIKHGTSPRKAEDCLNKENVRVILRVLDSLGEKLTRSTFAKLLSGLPGQSGYQQRFANSTHRGALRNLNWEEIVELVDVLMALALIEFGRGRLIRLTPSGKKALLDERLIAERLAVPSGTFFPSFSSEELDRRIEKFLLSRSVQRLTGPFDEGYALGLHGRYVGGTYKHTALGEKVYRFKYCGEKGLVEPLSCEVVEFLKQKKFGAKLNGLMAVPSTIRDRAYDPMILLCAHIAKMLSVQDYSNVISKFRETRPQKDLETLARKRTNVRGAFRIADPAKLEGQVVLVLDDLYDSGITLNEVCQTVRKVGAKYVYALALTRTIHVEK